jgi:hypothetical protein
VSFQRSVAVCFDCSQQIGRPAVQAFGSTPDHDQWLHAHATNCPSHTVRTVPGWLPPHEALRLAFGEDER